MAEPSSASPPQGPVKADDTAKLALLRTYDGFVFDLDGCLWKGNTPIPGATEVISLLRSQGKSVFFVTNNATRSRQGYVKKLTQLGFSGVRDDEVYGSAYAAAMLLKTKQVKKAYVIGEQGLVDEVEGAGVKVLGGPADSGKSFNWQGQEDPKLALDPEVSAVVVGLDREVNYYKLQHAMAYITKQKAMFVACNMDSRGNLASTDEWAGAGTMVAAVIGASETDPIVAGKPQALIMNLLCRQSGLTMNRLCVVGDRLDTDIAWGIRCGTGTLLVLTGCTSEEQLKQADPKQMPGLYVDSIADLLTIKEKLSSWDSSCALM